MLVDSPQSRHAHATSKLVHHPHIGHSALATQIRELSLDQQVHRMHRREQAQQVNAKELGHGVFVMSSARATLRPAFVDEIVGNEQIQEFEQGHRAGRRKIGIHAPKPTAGNLTRQRRRLTP